jgi:hypothetical protein
VASYLYGIKGDVAKQLRVSLLDPSIRDVFDFIYQTIPDDSIDRSIKVEFKKEVMRGFGKLIQLDSDSSAKILLKFFSNDIELFLSKLEAYPEYQYSLLKSLYHLVLVEEFDGMTKLESNAKLNETYISLLCKYDPKSVYSHLIGHPEYDVAVLLRVCRENGIRDAYAYLLERSGDFASALKLNLENLFQQLEACRVIGHDDPSNEAELWRLLRVAADLCERSSQRKDAAALQSWNEVLSRIVGLQLSLQDKRDSEEWFYSLLVRVVRDFVGYMSIYVSMDNILRCMFSTGAGLKFKPYRDVIEHMLSSFSFDSSILRTARRCFESDVSESYSSLVRLGSGALCVSEMNCVGCGNVLGVSARLFVHSGCGHVYHLECLKGSRCAGCD